MNWWTVTLLEYYKFKKSKSKFEAVKKQNLWTAIFERKKKNYSKGHLVKNNLTLSYHGITISNESK